MGHGGGYTEADVVAASRAFSGGVVNVPGAARRRPARRAPRRALDRGLRRPRHDDTAKTLLGRTGAFDLDQALDVLLEQPATGTFVATKLYRQLPSPSRRSLSRRRWRRGSSTSPAWSTLTCTTARPRAS
jgi:uncharacterized protein (DUF1800 family)